MQNCQNNKPFLRLNIQCSSNRSDSIRESKLIKKAFTLIELLIVIAIIGILASMLLPTLNLARDFAKTSVCTSNLKQIGLSLSMYAVDYQTYPPESPTQWNVVFAGANHGLFPQYFSADLPLYPGCSTKTANIFDCPGNYNRELSGHKYIAPDYGFNYYLFGDVFGNVSRIKETKILAADCLTAESYFRPWVRTRIYKCHSGGANFLYTDGHVSYFKIIPNQGY